MKAVHFGAGSIGRGFIGDLLNRSGYQITFIDINKRLAEQVNKHGSYDLYLIDDNYRKKTINLVHIISPTTESDKAITAICEADLITTSVWADNLAHIAPLLYQGLLARREKNKPKINIIVCENAVKNGDMLVNELLNHQPLLTLAELSKLACFPNTVVDRLVLNTQRDGVDTIDVGRDFELIIEQTKLVEPNQLPIKGAKYCHDLAQYLARKLYIINGGHALAGYIGHIYGYRIIQDVFNQPHLVTQVKAAMRETTQLLVKCYPFNYQELLDYIDFAINRFQTPGVVDTINRVCRSPIRKLAPKDRLVGPALLCEQYQCDNQYLLVGIAAAFLFENPADAQAVELNKYISINGIDNAITHYTNIKNTTVMYEQILQHYYQLQIMKKQQNCKLKV